MPSTNILTISPGQALLVLIDHYRNNAEKLQKLKQLYLLGPQNDGERKEFKEILRDPLLARYIIKFDSQTINEDPARRYFETHLGFETLKVSLSQLSKDSLNKHFSDLENLYKRVIKKQPNHQEIEIILTYPSSDRKELPANALTVLKEYYDLLKRIEENEIFGEFSDNDENKEKLKTIVKCAFLGLVNAWSHKLPIDIYGSGVYEESYKGRRLIIEEVGESQHYGLVKSKMPLPFFDAAKSTRSFGYVKPSDQASFVEEAPWVKENFERLVHPFSNSISGTVLCSLRAAAQLQREGLGGFTHGDDFALFSKSLISVMLSYSGGHTLREYTAPFELTQVQKEFRKMPNFDRINLSTLFNDTQAYSNTLERSINYNRNLLNKRNTNMEIEKLRTTPSDQNALIKTVNENIKKRAQAYIKRIDNRWFSSNVGDKKKAFVQKYMQEIQYLLKYNHFEEAFIKCNTSKNEFEKQFGTKVAFGKKSKGYEVLEQALTDISTLRNTVPFKSRLKALKDENSAPPMGLRP